MYTTGIDLARKTARALFTPNNILLKIVQDEEINRILQDLETQTDLNFGPNQSASSIVNHGFDLSKSDMKYPCLCGINYSTAAELVRHLGSIIIQNSSAFDQRTWNDLHRRTTQTCSADQCAAQHFQKSNSSSQVLPSNGHMNNLLESVQVEKTGEFVNVSVTESYQNANSVSTSVSNPPKTIQPTENAKNGSEKGNLATLTNSNTTQQPVNWNTEPLLIDLSSDEENDVTSTQSQNISFAFITHKRDTSKSNSDYYCSCGVKFATAPLLNIHLSFYKNRRFVCAFCGDRLKTEGSLTA